MSAAPTRKVIAGGLSGSMTLILVWMLNTYALPEAKPIPAEIAVAISTVLSFAVSYFVPPAADDTVHPPS